MNTRMILFVPLFAGLMCVLGLVKGIYLPGSTVPITAQTLGVMLAGILLGSRYGALSQILFLVLVALGLKVLPDARGGLDVFFGPSAGFLLSWPVAAFTIGFLVERFQLRSLWTLLIANFIGGIVVIYLIGAPIMAMMLDMSIVKGFVAMQIYVPGDLIKVVIASFVGVSVLKALRGTVYQYITSKTA
ncbi:MAG: biotin transporter BioY [Bacilli bacterium]